MTSNKGREACVSRLFVLDVLLNRIVAATTLLLILAGSGLYCRCRGFPVHARNPGDSGMKVRQSACSTNMF